MSVFSGDFLGFQLGDIHSSQLNITRVSNNNRYSENLVPNFNDTTAAVPGGDGTYYWNTFYTQRPFTIDFAFDNLSDEDIVQLRRVFGFKGVQRLIFDESLYKVYYVKCSAPPTLKYISFTQDEYKIYKGEGSVNLVAYYPYGLSSYEISIGSQSEVDLTNSGDLDTPIRIYYPLPNSTIQINLNGNEQLKLENITKVGSNDQYICIDNKTHLVEGLDQNFKKTGKLYNRFITKGDFFLLPTDRNTLTSNVDWNSIKFHYLYY